MTSSGLKFGSPEWITHMRRSLAQRKRHGEKIDDIEGLIAYIVKKGPSKEKGVESGGQRSSESKRKKADQRQNTSRRASSGRKRLSERAASKRVKSSPPQAFSQGTLTETGVKIMKV